MTTFKSSFDKMPLTINFQTITSDKFEYPFRMFISGSSQSGKTYFARELLARSDLFQKPVKSIKYYHPDYLENAPIDWHTNLTTPISYQSGLPSMEELCKFESDTCVVLDDLYEECINSKAVDYLFRVLSGKKSLSVIIMSQRYFAHGRFGMNIRNNCNFTVLLRNTDSRVNQKIASLINVRKAADKAIGRSSKDNLYPYLFIDSSPRGQVSGYRLYTNIFSKFLEIFTSSGMKAYIIPEQDFLKHFELLCGQTAKLKNGIYEKSSNSTQSASNTSKTESIQSRFRERQRKRDQRKIRAIVRKRPQHS